MTGGEKMPDGWLDAIYDSLPLFDIKHMDFPQFCLLAERVRDAVEVHTAARLREVEAAFADMTRQCAESVLREQETIDRAAQRDGLLEAAKEARYKLFIDGYNVDALDAALTHAKEMG